MVSVIFYHIFETLICCYAVKKPRDKEFIFSPKRFHWQARQEHWNSGIVKNPAISYLKFVSTLPCEILIPDREHVRAFSSITEKFTKQ